MALLLHGTTRKRAIRIIERGPEIDFVEPNGQRDGFGFSMCLESGSFPLNTPAEYARAKDRLFPEDGGPVILEVEVPDEIVAMAFNETPWLIPSDGTIEFAEGDAYKKLLLVWLTLPKRTVPVNK